MTARRFSAAACLLLSSCGLYAPQKELFYANAIDQNGRSRNGKIESNVIANIRCEITKGIYDAVNTGSVPWMATWGTTISLNLVWDEQSSISPGLSYSDPFGVSKTFTLGAGGTASAHATRNEAITFTLENKTLLAEAVLTRRANGKLDCSALADGVTVESDLDIDQFIYDKATIAGGHEATTKTIDYPQFSTFQETLTFVASVSANMTPTWKLTRFTANPSGNFLSATRMKTSTVVITLGPLAKHASPAGPAELAIQAQVQHDAALTGGAVASSLLSQGR
ncbi:hypothetical protein [Mesorhizobium sp. B2-3-4]|uniref:hypothetical protein n=1 Tax=Mesorhizobium sp. B2-3-4 TaxID=2589959 RepID=UPI001128A4EB|nr:hypothetical protein [Mesorhizobium sp. B2-3-4]TPM34181.1 hypothetical protein FJ967_22340 [Mesorhizobium sp. B2-3-4]